MLDLSCGMQYIRSSLQCVRSFICGMWAVSGAVVSDSLGPHPLWATRLLCPWDSPGKSTGVGSPSLLQENLPYTRIEPGSPAFRADSMPAKPPGRVSQMALVVKNLPANARDLRDTDLIPRLGRCAGERLALHWEHRVLAIEPPGKSPEVAEPSMGLKLLLQAFMECVVSTTGQDLALFSILHILLSVEEPVWDLVQAWTLHSGDRMFHFILGEHSCLLGEVGVCFPQHDISASLPHTLNCWFLGYKTKSIDNKSKNS